MGKKTFPDTFASKTAAGGVTEVQWKTIFIKIKAKTSLQQLRNRRKKGWSVDVTVGVMDDAICSLSKWVMKLWCKLWGKNFNFNWLRWVTILNINIYVFTLLKPKCGICQTQRGFFFVFRSQFVFCHFETCSYVSVEEEIQMCLRVSASVLKVFVCVIWRRICNCFTDLSTAKC